MLNASRLVVDGRWTRIDVTDGNKSARFPPKALNNWGDARHQSYSSSSHVRRHHTVLHKSDVAQDNWHKDCLVPFGQMKLKWYSKLSVFLFNGMTKDGLWLACPQNNKEWITATIRAFMSLSRLDLQSVTEFAFCFFVFSLLIFFVPNCLWWNYP